jgi:D-galactonate transporter
VNTVIAREPVTAATHTSEAAARTYRKIAWRIVPFLLVCYIVSYLDRVNLSFAKLQFMQDLGFTDAVYGLGGGLFYLTYVLFEVPSNLYLQRVGARATLLRIMTLWGAVTVLMSLITSPTHLYVARCLLGAAEAGFFPGVILYLTYWFPSTYRARIMSIFLMGIPVSGWIGGPLAGWIMHDLSGLHGLRGWQLLFIYEGLPAIALGITAYFYLTNGVAQAKWLSDSEKAIVLADLQAEHADKSVTSSESIGTLFRDPRFYAAVFAYFAITCATVAMSLWVPTLIKGLAVNDLRTIGWLSAVPYLAATVGLWAIGRHSDYRLERRYHVAVSLVASAAGFILLGFTGGSVGWTIALLALAATGLYGAIPVFWAIPTSYLSRSNAPAGIALISSLGCLGGFLSTAIIGWVKSLTGSLDVAMGAVGLLLIVASAGLLIAFPARMIQPARANAS